MAKFTPPFAYDGERRSTTSDEQEHGIPCGPFDRPMWHGLFHNVQAELGNLISASGQTDSEKDLSQVARAVQSGRLNYGIAGGTANALTVTLNPAPVSLKPGMVINVAVTQTSTGAATININGLGEVPIKRLDGTALNPGELVSGAIVALAFDGTSFQLASFSPASYAKGSLIATRVITQSGIYVPTPGTQSIIVVATGGGGGGGGVAATGVNQYGCAGGGGGGDTQIGRFIVNFSSVYMTIGSGGAGGGWALNGSPGGTTSFGPLITAPGGEGGAGSGAASSPSSTVYLQSGGRGGSAGAGGNIARFAGSQGGYSAGGYAISFCSGFGGASYWGAGASANWSSSFSGVAATCFGTGGSGAGASSSSAGANGGNGAPGVIEIREYA